MPEWVADIPLLIALGMLVIGIVPALVFGVVAIIVTVVSVFKKKLTGTDFEEDLERRSWPT